MVEEALEGRLCVVHQFPSKREEVTKGKRVGGAWASLNRRLPVMDMKKV
jgi:hypothetical protein